MVALAGIQIKEEQLKRCNDRQRESRVHKAEPVKPKRHNLKPTVYLPSGAFRRS